MKIQYETDDIVRIRAREEFVGTVVHSGADYLTVHDGANRETVHLNDVVEVIHDRNNVVAPFLMTEPVKSTKVTDSTENRTYRFRGTYIHISDPTELRYLDLESPDFVRAAQYFKAKIVTDRALRDHSLMSVRLVGGEYS